MNKKEIRDRINVVILEKQGELTRLGGRQIKALIISCNLLDKLEAEYFQKSTGELGLYGIPIYAVYNVSDVIEAI